MIVQPHQAPRCAADSSANCISPGSGMRFQPLAPSGAVREASVSYLLCTGTGAAWRDHPPHGGEEESPLLRLQRGSGQRARDGVWHLKTTAARCKGPGKEHRPCYGWWEPGEQIQKHSRMAAKGGQTSPPSSKCKGVFCWPE